jgi:hypothetical protein
LQKILLETWQTHGPGEVNVCFIYKKNFLLRIRSLWIALVNALLSVAGRSKGTNVMGEGKNARKRIRNEMGE